MKMFQGALPGMKTLDRLYVHTLGQILILIYLPVKINDLIRSSFGPVFLVTGRENLQNEPQRASGLMLTGPTCPREAGDCQ